MLKDLLNRPDAPSGDVQFRVPVLFWWFYFVVILGFAGVAAYVLVTQELSFWVLFLEAAFLFSIYRHIRERPRARCFVVTDEGIEQRGSRRRITLRWRDIVEATVRSHSLIVASAKNRITIPRGLPRYAELYSIIDSQAPSTALGTVSGRPLHFYYRSSLAFWHSGYALDSRRPHTLWSATAATAPSRGHRAAVVGPIAAAHCAPRGDGSG